MNHLNTRSMLKRKTSKYRITITTVLCNTISDIGRYNRIYYYTCNQYIYILVVTGLVEIATHWSFDCN
jgi:hypothetical protein